MNNCKLISGNQYFKMVFLLLARAFGCIVYLKRRICWKQVLWRKVIGLKLIKVLRGCQERSP